MLLNKDQLKQVVADQRAALLNKPYGIERKVLADIDHAIKLPHIITLTGLRRVGKSTLLRQIIRKYFADQHFYYLNFEDERLFRFKAEDFNLLYEALLELYGEQKTFFIDEIQNVAHFENFVRRFYEAGFKFIITGSSADLLSKEISTKLTGRHLDMVVPPFSFQEYLHLKDFPITKEILYNTIAKTQIKSHFQNYLIHGGMPEYLVYNEPEILSHIYDDIVIKDIAVRYKVANLAEMREVFLNLISNTANKFSFNKLKTICGIGSITTVKNYVHYLTETFFL